MSHITFDAGLLHDGAYEAPPKTPDMAPPDMAPVVRTGRRRGLVRRAAVWAAVMGAAACGAVMALRHLPALPPPVPEVPVAWREILKPVQIYDLQAPQLVGRTRTYAARRHEAGGGREDVIAFGPFDGNHLALRLRMFRRADEAPDAAPLYATIVGEAAKLGLSVTHGGLPDLIPTRFGRFEGMTVALGRPGSPEVPCEGVRLDLAKPALTITGLVCGAKGAAPTRAEVGCLIERLDVAAARDDRDLVDMFAASELKRNAACAGMRLGPDGLHAAWLDDKPAARKPVADPPATSRKSLRHRKGFSVTLAGR